MHNLIHYLEGFIEKFVDDQAVILCCDRRTALVDRSRLPIDARIGDFIVQVDHSGHFRIDREITEMHQREQHHMNDGCPG